MGGKLQEWWSGDSILYSGLVRMPASLVKLSFRDSSTKRDFFRILQLLQLLNSASMPRPEANDDRQSVIAVPFTDSGFKIAFIILCQQLRIVHEKYKGRWRHKVV
jgi:hypothetical protein